MSNSIPNNRENAAVYGAPGSKFEDLSREGDTIQPGHLFFPAHYRVTTVGEAREYTQKILLSELKSTDNK